MPRLRRRAGGLGATLKSVVRHSIDCSPVRTGYEPSLDEMVEVVFTVSPRVRRIGAHDPHSLSIWEYYRQIHWGSAIDLPDEGFEDMEEITIGSIELPAGESGVLSQLPSEFIIVFEPVTHSAYFLDVKAATAEPTLFSPSTGRTIMYPTRKPAAAFAGKSERYAHIALVLDRPTGCNAASGSRKPFLTRGAC